MAAARNLSAEVARTGMAAYDGVAKSLHLDGTNTPFDALAAFATHGGLGHASVMVMGDSTNDTQSRQRNLEDRTQTTQRWVYQFAKMFAVANPHIHTRYTRFDNPFNCLQGETGTKFFQEWSTLNATSTGRAGVECIATGGPGRWVRHKIGPHQWFTELDFAVEMQPQAWTQSGIVRLWQLSLATDISDLDLWAQLNTDKTITVKWVETSGSQRTLNFATAIAPATDTTQLSLRIKIRPDNGSGGCTGQLFVSPKDDDYHWTQVGADVVLGSTSNFRMRNGTAWFFAAGGTGHMQGRFFSCWHRAFVDGPTVLPISTVNWETWVPGQIVGGPSVDFYEAAYPTKAVDDTFDNDQWAPWMLPDSNTLLAIMSSSHNDSNTRGGIRFRALEQWVSNIRYRLPAASLGAISQNPDIVTTVAGNPPLANAYDHHFRTAQDASYWRRLDVGYIDTFRTFMEDPRSWESIMVGYHHPNDDATGLTNRFDRKTGVATNPVVRQAQVVWNAYMASPFATANPTELTRA